MKKKLLHKIKNILESDDSESQAEYRTDIENDIFPNLMLAPDVKSDALAKGHLMGEIDNYIKSPNSTNRNMLIYQVQILNSF
jgi:hypothetical protein